MSMSLARLADAPEPDHADGAVTQRRRQGVVALLNPGAGPHIAVDLREMPHRAEQQPERGIGNLLVEDVRRVGDDDVVGGGVLRIDVVVTDAEARHHFQLRQLLHQLAVDAAGMAADRDVAQGRGKAGEQCIVGGVLRSREMHRKILRKLFEQVVSGRPDVQNIGLVGRHSAYPCGAH
jgi:hypothetical protein